MAICALFFTNGLLIGSLVLRFPEIKDVFGLSASVYGATIALSSLGGILAGPFAAKVVRRLTSRIAASLLTIGLSATLRPLASPGSPLSVALYLLLACGFFLNGCSDSLVDVAQNMQGLRLQREYRRPIISSFHGMWSVGAAAGGGFGILTTALHMSLLAHTLIASLACIALGLLVLPFTLPGADPDNSEETDREDLSRVRTRPLAPAIVLGLLVVLCISGMLIEDAGSSWATLFMRDYANTGAALAGSGYVVLLSTHALGRFIADPLVGRFGPRAVVAGGGALLLVGMGGGLLLGTTPALLFGFATAGIRASASVPLAYNAAHDIHGMDPAVGLTIVSWLGRLAFLVAPPLVGVLVQHTSLLSAMLVIPAAGIALMASSLVLAPRRLRVQK